MRIGPVLLLAVVVVFAGCSVGPLGGEQSAPGGGADETVVPPDPETDRIGWVDGYWHNETFNVTNADGLNESEREKVIARSMARVEYVRGEQFEETVEVRIQTREEFREQRGGNYTDSFRTFDNVKFEAMLLVGDDEDSLAVQQANRGGNVLGFYETGNESITLVTETDQPVVDSEATLAHELVHALQDQRHDLSQYDATTRDQSNAQGGLVEGEAVFVERQYQDRCGAEWECLSAESGGGDVGDEFHFGVYYLDFFPYSDGPTFVADLKRDGGWAAVDDAFADPPQSSTQVINPEQYQSGTGPTEVELTDRTGDGWERVRVDDDALGRERADYAVLGQSAMTAMFAYTLHGDDDRQPVIAAEEFVNFDGERVNRSNPYDYGLDVTQGWAGDRLHVYQQPETGETGYVWRSEWDSAEDARQFARGYRALLGYWEGDPVGDSETWRIPEGANGFAGAYYVEQDGTTVTIVKAPSVEELDGVHADADTGAD